MIKSCVNPFYVVEVVDDSLAPHGKSFALQTLSGEDVAFNAALESGRLKANFRHILQTA